MKTKIPKNFEVKPLKKGQNAQRKATCGTCGLSWDDGIATTMTPVPSGRCPFEYFHNYEENKAKCGGPEVENRGHTPTPWELNVTGWCHEADIFENQSFIVRAVNSYEGNLAEIAKLRHSHEALLESLKDLIAKANSYRRAHIDESSLLESIIIAETTVKQAEGK